MAVPAIAMSRDQVERLVLEDPDRPWEIIRGQLREKPAMSFAHNHGALELYHVLRMQVDRSQYLVSVNLARLHKPHDTSVIPDVVVIPVDLTPGFRSHPRSVEIYADPVPLVAEYLSPSTGKYDVEGKGGIQGAWRPRDLAGPPGRAMADGLAPRPRRQL